MNAADVELSALLARAESALDAGDLDSAGTALRDGRRLRWLASEELRDRGDQLHRRWAAATREHAREVFNSARRQYAESLKALVEVGWLTIDEANRYLRAPTPVQAEAVAMEYSRHLEATGNSPLHVVPDEEPTQRS